jgi:hypothetical protein
MSKYTLIPFTEDSLKDAYKKWEAIVGEDAFDLEFSPLFDWAGKHIHETAGDSQAFNLSNNDAARTDAIVEVVTSRKGLMTKLLKIVPSPQFWDINNSRNEIIQVYTEVFFNVITKRGTDQSRKVKLYGRDDEMMSILRSLHSVWAIPNSTAEFEGRFLTIALN